ncbi:restriction endonuclease subunit S [Vreelandella malpeensis]|uniref:Restriction endonuclease subunit S n=1 Tax=Vreelandella malpeensis TaxID=1172368 RepID=A0ABS8DQ00_9GAMM|nr:restriction endonuclease subunit S [Halomonas malpeensis]MCB8888225.1 restriction endonuclease subunit S [Halomonas malpeensis]
MLLADLCDIHSGYTARSKLEPADEDGIPVLQLRDVAADGTPPTPPFQRYALSKLADHYFVTHGDVVFRSRGVPSTASAIDDALKEPVLVVSPLVILHPDTNYLLPTYLAWAINQPDAQRRLGAEAQGTSLRMIPMKVLERLEIAVPDLATQRRIVELDALARQEGRLLRELATHRERLSSLILGEAAMAADHKEMAP